MATLPTNCRPSKRLVFNLNNEDSTSQVDVLKDGRVIWNGGGKSHHKLSLYPFFIDGDGTHTVITPG